MQRVPHTVLHMEGKSFIPFDSVILKSISSLSLLHLLVNFYSILHEPRSGCGCLVEC